MEMHVVSSQHCLRFIPGLLLDFRRRGKQTANEGSHF